MKHTKKLPKPQIVRIRCYKCAYVTIMAVLTIFPIILQRVMNQSQNAVYWRTGTHFRRHINISKPSHYVIDIKSQLSLLPSRWGKL